MSVVIDWAAFAQVFVAALVGAVAVVALYALGLRLLVVSGRPPVVAPAEFPEAITVLTGKERRRAERAAEKAARKNPLSPAVRRLALIGAYASFVLCAVAIAGGLALILIGR